MELKMPEKEQKLCYWCQETATSKEHVPPKCFFPEAKDVFNGVDYRANLITVPSCDEHNTSKSDIDEYIFYVVLSHHDGNLTAFNQFVTKAMRSFEKRPWMKDRIYRDRTDATLNGEDTMAFRADMDKFNSGMEATSRAIYYYETEQPCTKSISIHAPMLYSNYGDRQSILNNMLGQAEILFSSIDLAPELKGENKDVFYYQFHTDKEKQVDVLKMVFYSGFKVFTIFK